MGKLRRIGGTRFSRAFLLRGLRFTRIGGMLQTSSTFPIANARGTTTLGEVSQTHQKDYRVAVFKPG